MKVLMWSELFWRHHGGVETFCEKLVDGLSARGFEFTVITSDWNSQPEEESRNGVKIVRLPLRESFAGNLKLFAMCKRRIQEVKNEFKPDLSHVNVSGPSFIHHLTTLNAHPHPTAVTLHFYMPAAADPEGAIGKLFRVADWVNAVSLHSLRHMTESCPWIGEKSSVIYNALPLPAVSPSPIRWDEPRVLSFGRMVLEKGFDLSLEAFREIHLQHPGARYQLIGSGPDLEHFQALSSKLDLGERVEFSGHLSTEKLFQAIDRAAMVVVPSRHRECFGLVALEAMQMARPVIASRSGGMVEVVKHDETGQLVDREDVQSLARSMDFYLSNPEIAARHGEAGLKRAKRKFAIEPMLDSYERLFRKLTNRA